MGEPPKWPALVCAVLLLGVAVWEIVATRLAATSVPDDAAWLRAAAVVRAEHRPGDLIVFAPDWVDPTGRMHLGDLISIDMAARMDDARYGRIWELSIRGAHALSEQPAFEKSVDGIVVRRYERSPETVLADVRELVPKAKVENAAPRVELAEVGFEPHRCILVTPSPNTPGRMTFALPGGRLVGYAGIADIFTRRENRAPATLDVEVGGKVVASISPGVDDGWMRFETRVPAGDVTFVVRSTTGGLLVCFAAEVRK